MRMFTVVFDDAVTTGYGDTWEEAVEYAYQYMQKLLGDRFKQIGELYKVTAEEHGTTFLVYLRGGVSCTTPA